MTLARPHLAFVHLVLAALLLIAGLLGGASVLFGAEDRDCAAVEVEYEPDSEQDPEPEDDRDDDEDDAVARSDAEGVDPGQRVTPPLTYPVAPPSAELDRIFRPPIG